MIIIMCDTVNAIKNQNGCYIEMAVDMDMYTAGFPL